MTLNKAKKLLEEEYEKAKNLKFVYNPMAYALYQVWRKADRERCKFIGKMIDCGEKESEKQ